MSLESAEEWVKDRSREKVDPWNFPIQYLKGVGAKIAELLESQSFHSLWDILFFLPRDYQDRRKLASYEELLEAARNGDAMMSKGKLEKYFMRYSPRSRRRWMEAKVSVKQEQNGFPAEVQFLWFQKQLEYIKKNFPEGSEIVFSGKASLYRGRPQLSHPQMQKTSTELSPWEFGSVIPIYRELGGLSTRVLRKILFHAIYREELSSIPSSLPESLEKKYSFPNFMESLREVHFPKRWNPLDSERVDSPHFRRLAFEELFYMSLALKMKKDGQSEESLKKVASFSAQNSEIKKLLDALPFELTEDQQSSLKEILKECSSTKKSMQRMLQGDVGAGKTVVAFIPMILSAQAGFQAALLAPTEILANQHFQNLIHLFPELSHRAVLLKGALTPKQKEKIRAQIASGEVDLIVGTHALLTESTHFKNLGLVVIDEQHRFGVEQRLFLKNQGEWDPHMLVMTATPIPRSLALTLYGDLELSVIKTKPKGRKPIETHMVTSPAKLKSTLRKLLEEGRQVYMVYPLVEESEELDLKDVKTAQKDWQKVFPELGIGLIHGKQKSSEKEKILRKFIEGELSILIATTVIEVGVDVPNATVMVIHHAERFGLSQLHQLRGRVGRGSQQSYCYLMTRPRLNEEAQQRLKILCDSNDGFKIAERDLELRGPGEFLGQRQSGIGGFRVAHALGDIGILESAISESRQILEEDPKLQKAENKALNFYLEKWWGDRIKFAQGS